MKLRFRWPLHHDEPANVSHAIAPLTSREQAYYWSHAWQAGEQETLGSLAAGHGKTFADADAAIRWLLSAEEMN